MLKLTLILGTKRSSTDASQKRSPGKTQQEVSPGKTKGRKPSGSPGFILFKEEKKKDNPRILVKDAKAQWEALNEEERNVSNYYLHDIFINLIVYYI